MAKYYAIKLSEVSVDAGAFSFSAAINGSLQLRIEGHWDTVLQYQYDIIRNRLVVMAQSSPLNDNGEYIRDYDYVDYYMSLYGLNLTDWLATDPVIPNDIKQQPVEVQVSMLQDRIAFCRDLKPVLLKYEEGLRWNVIVKDDKGVDTTAVIQPGGWFRNQADDYSFIFLSSKAYVGIDDLPYTTLVVRINNG